MEYQTPIAKVKGLGSAKTGTVHFWMQRISAIALIPLSIWMVIYTRHIMQTDYAEMLAWISTPCNSILAICWLVAAFYHAAIGLQVIMEDYIHSEWRKLTTIWAMKLLFLFLAISAIFAVFRLSLLS